MGSSGRSRCGARPTFVFVWFNLHLRVFICPQYCRSLCAKLSAMASLTEGAARVPRDSSDEPAQPIETASDSSEGSSDSSIESSESSKGSESEVDGASDGSAGSLASECSSSSELPNKSCTNSEPEVACEDSPGATASTIPPNMAQSVAVELAGAAEGGPASQPDIADTSTFLPVFKVLQKRKKNDAVQKRRAELEEMTDKSLGRLPRSMKAGHVRKRGKLIDAIMKKERKERKKKKSKGKPLRKFVRRIVKAAQEVPEFKQVLTASTAEFGESADAADVRSIWQQCVELRRACEKRDETKKRIHCQVAERQCALPIASDVSLDTFAAAFLTHDGNVEDAGADLHVEPDGDARTELNRQLQRQIAQEQAHFHRRAPLRTGKSRAPRAKAKAKARGKKDDFTELGDDPGWFLSPASSSDIQRVEIRRETFGATHGFKDNSMKLAGHQVAAVADMMTWYRSTTITRALYISACGTGKTLSVYAFCDLAAVRFVLWCFPNLTLLRQSLKAMQEYSQGREFKWAWKAVCSDRELKDERPDMAADEQTCTTTNATELGGWLAEATRQAPGGKSFWVLATYQSVALGIVVAAQKKHRLEFDLRVADEAHFCAGPEPFSAARVTDAQDYHRKFAYATLAPERGGVKARRHLNCTATPTTGMQGDVGRQRFGLCIHNFPMSKAIEAGVVRRPEVVLAPVDGDAARRATLDYSEWLRAEKREDSKQERRSLLVALANARAILKLNEKEGCRKMIIFARTNKRCKRLELALKRLAPKKTCVLRVAGLPEMGAKLRLEKINGHMHPQTNEWIPSKFSLATNCLLINCDAIATGFDLPALVSAYFFDPRIQDASLIQAVGRVGRIDRTLPPELEQVARVIVPIYNVNAESFAKEADSMFLEHVEQIALRRATGWIPNASVGSVGCGPSDPTRRAAASRTARSKAKQRTEKEPRLERSLERFRQLVTILHVFKRYDPCLGLACRLKRGDPSGAHALRSEGGTPARTGPADAGDWDALFDNPDESSAQDTLHLLRHSTLRSAQAAQAWAEEFDKLARRARDNSPCKGSEWLRRNKYECKHGRRDIDRARRSAVDALAKQVKKNAAKAKKREEGKRKKQKRVSNQKSQMKRPARSKIGRAREMSQNLAELLRPPNR
jgi:superfamily II DNA or RNA helicase